MMKCRLCRGATSKVLEMRDMPRSVQTLLSPDKLKEDRGVDVRVERCKVCGLVQLTGCPKGNYSKDYFFSVNFSGQSKAYQQDLADRWAKEHSLMGKRILEIGGGDGLFAEMLTAGGCTVTLIEPSPAACRIARGRMIGRVVEGLLTAKTFPGETFDAVVLRHVLEHVTKPREFLKWVRSYLKNGGKVLIEVPNIDEIVAKGRFQDFYAEHTLYFGADTLARAVTRAGFRVRENYTLEQGNYLVCVAEAPPLDLRSMVKGIAKFKKEARQMLESSIKEGRKVGIYGAGGRGISFLALIEASDLKIEYVVDADEKKWGRFTPVTHLRVVSPDTLRKEPVDDLLITAIAFQDEILEQQSWFATSGRRLGILCPSPRWLEKF